MIGTELLRPIATTAGAAFGRVAKFLKPASLKEAWSALSIWKKGAIVAGAAYGANKMFSSPDDSMRTFVGSNVDPRVANSLYGSSMLPMLYPNAMMNPMLMNRGFMNPMLMNPMLMNRGYMNPMLMNPMLMNRGYMNPMLMNPMFMNRGYMNPMLMNRGFMNPMFMNPGMNPAMGYMDPMTRLMLARSMGTTGWGPTRAPYSPQTPTGAQTNASAQTNTNARQVSSGIDWASKGDWLRLGQGISWWRATKFATATGFKDPALAEKAAAGATKMLGRFAETGIGGRMVAKASERAVAIAGAKTAGKAVGRFIPFLNAGIAAMDVAEAARIQKDESAGWLKKGLGWLTAGLSTVGALEIPGVSQVSSALSIATAIGRDFAPSSTVSTGTAAMAGGTLLGK
jgi:hypothetical protein